MGVLSNQTKHTTSLHTHEEEDFLNEIIDRATSIIDDNLLGFDLDENDSSEFSSYSSGPQRAVVFAMTPKYREIISRHDYSEKEIRRCWYSVEEKEKMNRSKDKMVARLEAGKPARGSATYRGLECWTTKGGQDLDEKIAAVVNAVMDEQDRQWSVNCDDHDRIAQVSATVTAESAIIARRLAMQDEKEAKVAWESLDESSLGSQHSSKNEEVPANPRKDIFNTAIKRINAQKAKKRTTISTNETEKRVSTDVAKENVVQTEEKAEKKKSKSTKSKKEKKPRRSNVDPPAPVLRAPSQSASELLMTMRMTARLHVKNATKA